jgi:hypothetical protein
MGPSIGGQCLKTFRQTPLKLNLESVIVGVSCVIDKIVKAERRVELGWRREVKGGRLKEAMPSRRDIA